MISIAVPALANVIGLAAAALAVVLFSRADGDWRTSLRSHRGLGLLSLFGAGCLLMVGGQLMVSRLLSYGPASRAEAQARMQLKLLEPLEGLTVHVQGPDPFRDRPESCLLRLRTTSKAGLGFLSEIPGSRLSSPRSDGAEVAATATPGEYILSWQTVVGGVTDQQGRVVAARIGQLNDWQRFDRFEAEVVARTADCVPVPDSLRIVTVADQPVELFHGRKTSHKAEQHGEEWVCAYHDPATLPNRLTGWVAEEANLASHPRRDLLLMGLLAAGAYLLLVGIGLLVWGSHPGAEGDDRMRATGSPEPANSPISPGEARMIGADHPAELEQGATRSWAPAWVAPAFVWGVWSLMLLASLAFIGKFTYNHPLSDDWGILVPFISGEQPITLGSLWAQEFEHRYFLPKAISLAAIKLSGGDFRAPLVVVNLALGGLAFAMIRVARSLRGWTSYTDAFFPLALLQWGFPPFLGGVAWMVFYLVPSFVASCILLIMVRWGTQLTFGTAMLAGFFLALLPLCSSAGILYLPFLALWLGDSAVVSWRSPQSHGKRTSVVILGWILTTLLLLLLYFHGLHLVKADLAKANPSVWDVCKTGVVFLTSGLGEIAEWAWPSSGLAMLILLALNTGTLIFVAWRDERGLKHSRALGLLFFTGAFVMLALGVGRGRAGYEHSYVFTYYVLAVPILCSIYFALGLYRSRRAGQLAQACLFVGLSLTIAVNIPLRLKQWREEHAAREAFERDLRQGMPPYILLARHGETLHLPRVIDSGCEYLRMMHRAGIGPFRHQQDDPAYQILPVPLKPVELNEVKWEGGVAHGTDARSSLTFALPKPMFVAGIRIRCSTPQTGAVSFGVAWKGSRDSEFPAPQYRGGGWPTEPLTIAVADTIDQIRISPNGNPVGFRPFDFQLAKLEMLLPVSRDVLVGQSMEQRGP